MSVAICFGSTGLLTGLNVDVFHMASVVYLLRVPSFVTRHNSSDALSLHLTSSVLP